MASEQVARPATSLKITNLLESADSKISSFSFPQLAGPKRLHLGRGWWESSTGEEMNGPVPICAISTTRSLRQDNNPFVALFAAASPTIQVRRVKRYAAVEFYEIQQNILNDLMLTLLCQVPLIVLLVSRVDLRRSFLSYFSPTDSQL